MMEYEYNIEYRPGHKHINADVLSRYVEQEKEDALLVQDVGEIEEWKKAQEEDDEYKDLIKELKETRERQSKISTNVHFFLDKEGLLRRLDKSNFIKGEMGYLKEQLVVPKKLRNYILKSYHDCKFSGHLGISKTYQKINQFYYWKNLYTDLAEYCKTCVPCQKRKLSPCQKAPVQNFPPVSRPWERMACDLVGPLSPTMRGNRYLLVCSDYLTRYPEAFALPNIKAETIARVLVEEVISRHGCSEYLLTDRGSNFCSSLFQEVCKLLGIKRLLTTAYHPETDGLVERLNQTLINMISTQMEEGKNNWDEVLPYVLLAYRNSPHTSVGETPAFLLYGRDLTLPDEIKKLPRRPQYMSHVDYRQELVLKMGLAHEFVSKELKIKDAQRLEKSEEHRKYKDYPLGSLVLLHVPRIRGGEYSKFASKNVGPYRVIKKIGAVNYIIRHSNNPADTQKVHVNRLKWFYQRKNGDPITSNESPANESSVDRKAVGHKVSSYYPPESQLRSQNESETYRKELTTSAAVESEISLGENRQGVNHEVEMGSNEYRPDPTQNIQNNSAHHTGEEDNSSSVVNEPRYFLRSRSQRF